MAVGSVLFFDGADTDLCKKYNNMGKIIASEWISLDGIYDAGTMNQWWLPYDSPERQQYIQQVIQDCDSMLYGRKTYQMLYPYWSGLKNNEMGVAGKLNAVKKYLVSSTLKKGEWENTTIIGIDELGAIKKATSGNILITGSGSLVAALIKAGLVDEVKLLVQPHIMGTGERFFAEDMQGALQLNASRLLDKGVMQLCYAVI
jgi:dihydrofolate reductase